MRKECLATWAESELVERVEKVAREDLKGSKSQAVRFLLELGLARFKPPGTN